ncbi:MAG: protein BatD [bacterium]|nr:protein BatD [bacterium]
MPHARCAAAALAFSALTPVAGAQDLSTLSVSDVRDETAARNLALEVRVASGALYAGGRIRLSIELAVEADDLDDRLIQLFRRELAVPVQIQAPWLTAEPAGAVALDAASAESAGPDASAYELALGEEITKAHRIADRTRDGRVYRVFQLERDFRAERKGLLAFAAPLVRFAYTNEYREDPFRGRVATDRVDAFVMGNALQLDVLALPEDGQPIEFTGAVGQYTIRATVDEARVPVGGSVQLDVLVAGDGDLTALSAPSLGAARGIAVLGHSDSIDATGRTFHYELAVQSAGVRAIPPIPFAFFDPEPPAGYMRIRTEAIPLEVRTAGAPPSTEQAAPPEPGDRGPGDRGPGDRGPGGRGPNDAGAPESGLWDRAPLVALGAAALGLFAFFLVRRVRANAQPGDQARDRADRARDLFRKRSTEPGADALDALSEYLATRLGCAVPAVVGADLPERLRATGAPPELAARAVTVVDALHGARYGGAPAAPFQDVARLVAELDAARITLP